MFRKLLLSEGIFSPHYRLHSTSANVPRLPIPNLEDTGLRYLRSISALVEKDELENHAEIVADFVAGVGERLHKLLLKRDEDHAKVGGYPHFYFQKEWDTGYLGARCPNPIHINPQYLFKPDPKTRQQVQRSAAFLFSMFKWHCKARSESLEPDPGNIPQCSSGYKTLFGTARIPKLDMDEIKTHAETSNHIVVLRSNRFFKVDLCDEHGSPISIESIENCLGKIVETASSITRVPGIDTLTALPRDDWAKYRDSLYNYSSDNKTFFDTVDSALVVLCLDHNIPTSTEEISRSFLHGLVDSDYPPGSTNRWYDKHQVICDGTGNLGMNFEHSHNDGMVWNRMCAEVMADMNDENPPKGLDRMSEPSCSTSEGRWSEILVGLPEGFADILNSSYVSHQKLSENCDTVYFNFDEFGKNQIKKWGLSPDGVLQMVFQLAYYKLHNKVPPTYEAASTKSFSHGRTETIRSATPEAAEWVKFMSRKDYDKEKARILFESVVANHVELAKAASSGQGVDRHLLALQSLAAEFEEHALFDTPLFKHSNSWTLSTSNVTSPFLSLFGFGAVVENGYGLGYCIFEDNVPINITSWNSSNDSSSSDMASFIQSSAKEILGLFK